MLLGCFVNEYVALLWQLILAVACRARLLQVTTLLISTGLLALGVSA